MFRKQLAIAVSIYLSIIGNAAATIIERDFYVDLSPIVVGDDGRDHIRGMPSIFVDDPIYYSVGDELVLNIFFSNNQVLLLNDIGETGNEDLMIVVGISSGDEGLTARWSSQVVPLLYSGGINSIPTSSGSTGGGGGLGYSRQTELTNSAGIIGGIQWSVTVVEGSTGFPAMFTAIDGPKITADRIRVLTVPEPATLALFGLGLAGIGFSRRKKA